MRSVAAAILIAAALGAQPQRAIAQDYPTRPVTIVVPFSPGGGVDQMARLVAAKLEQRWGKTFVIENKPGAGSIVAATAVQKAAPDGYTLLMAPAPTMAINVALYKNLPYKPLDDFVPLALLSGTPFVLLVNPNLPANSVTEFIAYAKANPGKLSFASAGPGVPHHLFMELFKSMTGLEMSHVPYRGSLPGLNDLVAGHIPVMFCDIGPSAGMIKADKVRALGISSRARHPSFPEIPPIAEVGLPAFDVTSWQMIVGPAGMPRAVATKLNAELTSILAMPDVKEQILRYGFLPLENRPPEALQEFVKSEIARWSRVVADAGLAGSQ